MVKQSLYDVLIVGGGPAGLSCALVLGRCRRSVVLCDSGKPRNAPARAMHGFITRNGVKPQEFLRIAREELAEYPRVRLVDAEATSLVCDESKFTATLSTGEIVHARRAMLATGVVDELPQIPGIEQFYGHSVHHCPYCDGWEVRDKRLVVYGQGTSGCGLALELCGWSRDIIMCTGGEKELTKAQKQQLEQLQIPIETKRISRLEGEKRHLERVVFEDGSFVECDAMFFSTSQRQHSSIPSSIGCKFNEKGTVRTGEYEQTHMHGLYVAGDASHKVQSVIIAAAEGAEAAVDINQSLLREEFGEPKE